MAQKVWRVVWFDGLNVRGEPVADGAVVGELDMGATVVELELRDGWIRHAGGWNRLNHPEVPELEFLRAEGAAAEDATYEQQRAAMAKQEQEMLEKVIEESRKAGPIKMQEGGVFEPCEGLVSEPCECTL